MHIFGHSLKLKFLLGTLLCGLFLTGCVGDRFAPKGWAGPTVSDEVIYVVSPKGDFLAIDAEDQSIRDLTPKLEEQPSSLFGCQGASTPALAAYSTPIVSEGIAYVAAHDGEVFAIKATNGAEIWRYKTYGTIVGNPALAGGTLVVASGDELIALDIHNSGDLLWNVPFKADGEIWGNLGIADGKVYFGDMKHNLYAVNIESGRLAWENMFNGAITSAPLIVENVLYIGTFESKFYALDTSDGDPKWGEPFIAEDWFWSTPAYNDGVIYVGSIDGNIHAIDAVTGKAKWSNPVTTDGKIRAAAIISEDVLIVADDSGFVYGLDVETGQQAWAPRDLDEKVMADPWVEDTTVYLLTEDSVLYALNTESGNQLWSKSLEQE
ncbi:MAG: PQQ-binding-like beta-propeller repeat protein [Chloroflexota bacterium]|nr:PQQ-binding-like beta-propeller repeat protein [Chloroflexota bacterium]